MTEGKTMSGASTSDARSADQSAMLEALLQVVSSIHDVMKQLLELATEKLAAMRAADAAGLQACAARECAALERMFGQEQERDAVLARAAQSLRWEGPLPPRLSEIADRISEPHCSRLRAKIAGLRQTAVELQGKNKLAAEVARHLHKHLRAIFEEIAGVDQERAVYGPHGQPEQRATKTWVDAVG
jgi:hypothetical protein